MRLDRPPDGRKRCRTGGRAGKTVLSVPWSENILKDGLTGRFDTYLVWEKDGIVAGYCALRVLADEGEIQRIAVLPSWRRHGIAKSLMEAMIQVSKEKGAVQMSLEVRGKQYRRQKTV